MEATVAWWMWMILGLILLALEVMTPGGFFIAFFGVAALVIGALDLVGLAMPFGIQCLLFAALSVVSIVLFRKPLLERFEHRMPHGKVDSLVGETAMAMSEIAAGAFGKAELRGTSWNAHNIGEESIARAGRCRVIKVEGLTLHVRA